ncbi:unnamed protein product [Arabidopsis arenosa]|uniref:DUF4283 domain-containing protein n=1 Tax=Arabidopsis arenosa TaxID=38785 RepID=A0A8S1ZHS7_ARAAE|nr:unnamed protein product [Arabidopsis arenosa]
MGSPPPVADPPPLSEVVEPSSPKTAWSSPLPEVSVSQAKPEFDLVNGVARVSIPVDVVDEGIPLWKSFVVGYFMGDAPHVGTIHATVNRIWSSATRSSRVDVQFLNPTTILFRIDDEQTRSRVLRRRYWHIADIPLVVNEWSPETANEKPDLSAMPLWVDFKNVPGYMFSRKGLRFLADITGNYVKLHPNTERCTRLDMARVLVQVDLGKQLTEEICLEDKSGSTHSVSVSYPWLPPRCSDCFGWGHQVNECVKKNKSAVSQPVHGSPVQKIDDSLAVTVLPGNQNSTEIVTALLAELESVKASPVVRKDCVQNEATTEKDGNWSLVTRPGKQNSPQRSLGTESPLRKAETKKSGSPSGFSVLENVTEEGEIVETEEEQSGAGCEMSLANKKEDLLQTAIGDGKETFFWLDHWLPMGRLIDIVGDNGIRGLGVQRFAKVSDVVFGSQWGLRRCRDKTLEEIKSQIHNVVVPTSAAGKDKRLWLHYSDDYRPNFSTARTWDQLRSRREERDWSKLQCFT